LVPLFVTGTGTGCVIFIYLMLLLGCVAVMVTGTVLGSGCRCSAYLSSVVALPSWALLLAWLVIVIVACLDGYD
jgi:hypothetical protein